MSDLEQWVARLAEVTARISQVADSIEAGAAALATYEQCHAGAGHGPAAERGQFGNLCGPCWIATRALRDRICKRGG